MGSAPAGIKALGYVVVETAKPGDWDRFLTEFVGAMRAPDAADGAALYRVDDRANGSWRRDMKWRAGKRSMRWR